MEVSEVQGEEGQTEGQRGRKKSGREIERDQGAGRIDRWRERDREMQRGRAMARGDLIRTVVYIQVQGTCWGTWGQRKRVTSRARERIWELLNQDSSLLPQASKPAHPGLLFPLASGNPYPPTARCTFSDHLRSTSPFRIFSAPTEKLPEPPQVPVYFFRPLNILFAHHRVSSTFMWASI